MILYIRARGDGRVPAKKSHLYDESVPDSQTYAMTLIISACIISVLNFYSGK